MLGNWISTCKRVKLDAHLTPGPKINSKWVKDLTLSAKIIKLTEENMGETLCDIGFGNDFLDVTAQAQATKEKIKWTFIRIKNFCASEDTIKRVKRQTGKVWWCLKRLNTELPLVPQAGS